MTDKHTAYLGLGSNIGNRLQHLRSAVDALAADPHTQVTKRSAVYESEPEGPSQEGFCNAVVEIETELDPNGLLALCQQVENSLGRVRTKRWGPRTIDIDILLYDDLVVDEDQPNLKIPHPRMWTREFVCVPLAEVAPADSIPDREGCIAGRIIRKVGELEERSKAKGA